MTYNNLKVFEKIAGPSQKDMFLAIIN
jgi:hypothetical protein